MQTPEQIVDELLKTPKQKLNDNPRWVIGRLKNAFALAVEGNHDDLPHFRAIATHLTLSFAVLSDDTASQEPPNRDLSSPEFRDWLVTLAVNALVLSNPLRTTFRKKFLEHVEAYLSN